MATVPSAVISSPRNHLIMEAACYVIAHSISSVGSGVLQGPSAKKAFRNTIISQGLRHRRAEVQEAAATVLTSLSELSDQTGFVER